MASRNSYSIVALERGLELLQILAREERSYSLQEIVVLSTIPKTTVFRLLMTLEAKGFVERSPEGRYHIGLQLGRVSKFAHAAFDLQRIADPHLKQLHQSSSDTINLAAWRTTQVIYVEVLATPLRTKIVELPGTVAPLHASALGKAIAAQLNDKEVGGLLRAAGMPPLTPNTITSVKSYLSEISEVKSKGYAFDIEETDLGAICVAAPLMSHDGVVGAVSISATVARMNKSRLQILIPELLRACGQISEKLGGRPETVAKEQALETDKNRRKIKNARLRTKNLRA